jgi:hypothetical protein
VGMTAKLELLILKNRKVKKCHDSQWHEKDEINKVS